MSKINHIQENPTFSNCQHILRVKKDKNETDRFAFRKNKIVFVKKIIMNVVLNFFYRDKLPECFLTFNFPTKKCIFSLQGY